MPVKLQLLGDIDPAYESFRADMLDGIPLISAILEWNDHTEAHITKVIGEIESNVKKIAPKTPNGHLDGCEIAKSKYLLKKGDFLKALSGFLKMSDYIIGHMSDHKKICKFRIADCYKCISDTVFYDPKCQQKLNDNSQWDAADDIKSVSKSAGSVLVRIFTALLFPPAYPIVSDLVNAPIGNRGWKSKDDLLLGLDEVRKCIKKKYGGETVMQVLANIADGVYEDTAGDYEQMIINGGKEDTADPHWKGDSIGYAYLVNKMCMRFAKKILYELGHLCRGMLVAADKVAKYENGGVFSKIITNLKES